MLLLTIGLLDLLLLKLLLRVRLPPFLGPSRGLRDLLGEMLRPSLTREYGRLRGDLDRLGERKRDGERVLDLDLLSAPPRRGVRERVRVRPRESERGIVSNNATVV